MQCSSHGTRWRYARRSSKRTLLLASRTRLALQCARPLQSCGSPRAQSSVRARYDERATTWCNILQTKRSHTCSFARLQPTFPALSAIRVELSVRARRTSRGALIVTKGYGGEACHEGSLHLQQLQLERAQAVSCQLAFRLVPSKRPTQLASRRRRLQSRIPTLGIYAASRQSHLQRCHRRWLRRRQE